MENKIIIKIQKLLALSKSDNGNEAKTSLMMAQRLLAKYNLSIADVSEEEKEKIIEICTDQSGYSQWVRFLASKVALNFKCKALIGIKYRIIFTGYETDAHIAKDVFIYICEFVNKAGKNLAQSFYKKHGSAKGIKIDYILGFISGLEAGWESQKNESEEFALVLQIPPEIEKYTNKFEESNLKTGIYKRSGNVEARVLGMKDGKEFSSNKEKLEFR